MTGDGDDDGDKRRKLTPTEIAEVVRFSKCEQFTDLQFCDHIDNETEEYPVGSEKLTEHLWASPVLTTLGEGYESDIYEALVAAAGRVRGWLEDSEEKERLSRAVASMEDANLDLSPGSDADSKEEKAELIRADVTEKLAGAIRDAANGDLEEPAIMLQPTLIGEVGKFIVRGDADLVVVWPDDPDGADAHVRAYDIKAGEEKPHHQVQATLYALLIEDLLAGEGLDYALSTGIIDGETDVDAVDPEAMPEFAYEPRREDVRRLLAPDGFIQRVFDREETPPHELGKAAHESEFSEMYHVQAIEERDIRALGLSEAAQRAFHDRGIHTLEDVAELVRLPDDPRPYEDAPPVEPRHEETVRELNADTRIDERVQIIAQRAQVRLARLNHTHTHARDEDALDGAWLKGSGKADLPEDNPPWDAEFDNIETGTLVRAYIDVQVDYLNERVLMLNAAVECGRRDDDPVFVTSLVDEVPAIDDDFSATEGDLVEEFADDLFAAMRRVAREAGVDETGFHLYFHTNGERARFSEALERHSDRDATAALREVVDLRSAIHEDDDPRVEQRMVSIVQSAIHDHYAFAEPGYGIPHARSQLKWLNPDFWAYERETESGESVTINLHRAFRYQFATRMQQFVRDDEGCLVFAPGADDTEGRYPTLPRDESLLPLEYFWAADGIETPHDNWVPDDDTISSARYFECESIGGETVQIRREDIRELGRRLAHGLRDIERELIYCRRPIDDDRLQKQPLPLEPDALRQHLDASRPTTSLEAGCRDYLDFENRAEVEELHTLRDQPVRQRVKTGRALPIRVARIAEEDEPYDLEAELAYDGLLFDDATARRLLSACRLGEGETVLASALVDNDGEIVVDDEQWPIERAPLFRIEEVDTSDRNPVKLRVHYDAGDHTDDPYEKWNLSPSLGEPAGEWEARIDPGQTLLLDEDQMTVVRTHARQIIDGVGGTSLYRLLEDIRRDAHTPADLRTDAFDGDAVDDFLGDLDAAADDDEDLVSPNDKQRALIEKVKARISLLQGPPGTGKTTGALAPYLLSRAHAKLADREQFCGLVTAPTHTAIDEVLEDAADLHNRCLRHDVGDLDGVTMYRLTGSETPPRHKVAGNVEYVNYNDKSQFTSFVENVWSRFAGGASQMTLGGDDAAIVFATPHTIYRLARDIYAGDDDTDVADVYADPAEVFDAVAVDEASMLTLPELFMATPFAAPDSQTVIAGDHRQMPPVQQHDWEGEDRLLTMETLPFLSALNYCRFLRGETIDRVKRNDHIDPTSPEADIAFTKLRRTYRCHRTVTEFLRRWMYAKDGIDYTSEVDATLDVDSDVPDVLEPVFGDAPLVLITHDDRTSRQRNPSEAELTGRIATLIHDSDESVGVVTPHNAQKALLKTRAIDADTGSGDDEVLVDTVERFQGGEKDAIVISATVSDPAYLDAESDFIMNPNRLNVALSRMKKKLVVIAPESLFEMIPDDTDAYEDAQIWKGLYQTAATGEPDEGGYLPSTDEFDLGTEFNVYAFGGD